MWRVRSKIGWRNRKSLEAPTWRASCGKDGFPRPPPSNGEAWSVRPPSLNLSRSLSASLVGLHLPSYDSDYNFTPRPGFVPMAFVALLGFVGLGPPTSQQPMLAFGPRINTFLPLYSASKIHFFIPDCTTCFGQWTCTSIFTVGPNFLPLQL